MLETQYILTLHAGLVRVKSTLDILSCSYGAVYNTQSQTIS
jgi:hypothetical protein